MLALKKDDAKIVTEELAREWTTNPGSEDVLQPTLTRRADASLGNIPVSVWADAAARTVRVTVNPGAGASSASSPPLLALVPCYGTETPRLAPFGDAGTEFHDVRGMYYYLACEPGVLPP
jgi:hypothetical protein